MTDNVGVQRLAEQLEADKDHEPSGLIWLHQMLPRFALVVQNETSTGVQIVATHYGVGLPSGQVVLFTVGISTIAILPGWEQVHQLVNMAQGRIVLVMEEDDIRLETDTVA